MGSSDIAKQVLEAEYMESSLRTDIVFHNSLLGTRGSSRVPCQRLQADRAIRVE